MSVSRNMKIEIHFFISDYSLSVMLELLKEQLHSHTCDKVKFILILINAQGNF